jgi:outer membrane murein-binding lipoprotein Lpp
VRTALIVTLLAVAALLAACATTGQVEDLEQQIADLEQQIADLEQPADTARRKVSGTIITKIGSSDKPCYIGDNDLVNEGDSITIHDGSDATLAIGWLSNKTVNEDECTFTFTFPDVPTDKGFYRIRIPDIGSWSFNQVDLEADDWALELTTRG